MGTEKSYTNSFARIYDDIMSNVPYDLWYKYLQELLISYDKDMHKILEMACGTGNMSMRFAKDNREVSGIDKSSHMLNIAKEKARNKKYDVKFIQRDIKNFTFSDKFDFIFCIFDSLNYILKIDDMKKVFVNVYNSLTDDGIFIFDLNTITRLMSIEPGVTVFDGDNYTCFWEDIIDPENLIWKVKLKIYFSDDETRYFEEIHKERGYKKENIKNLLYDSGFSDVKVYKAFTFNKGEDSDNRLYYIVFKNDTKDRRFTVVNRFKKKIKWKVLNCRN